MNFVWPKFACRRFSLTLSTEAHSLKTDLSAAFFLASSASLSLETAATFRPPLACFRFAARAALMAAFFAAKASASMPSSSESSSSVSSQESDSSESSSSSSFSSSSSSDSSSAAAAKAALNALAAFFLASFLARSSSFSNCRCCLADIAVQGLLSASDSTSLSSTSSKGKFKSSETASCASASFTFGGKGGSRLCSAGSLKAALAAAFFASRLFSRGSPLCEVRPSGTMTSTVATKPSKSASSTL
mmetsp:Transcript_29531/g.53650  ORF Transcript_29531/g.53650 Transcript_29531/m.53650 type:complete len:246 (-) Transcript_29531:144-881(-)